MSNGDIDGETAFRLVLNRLVEETNEAHVVREKMGDLHGDLRKAEKRISDLAGVAERLAEREKGDAPLRELYEAGQNYLRAVNRSLSQKGRPLLAPREDAAQDVVEARRRLQKAMEAAVPYLDLIPF